MEPNVEESLALVDRVLQNVSGTRADHLALSKAMQVIAAACAPRVEDDDAGHV